MLKILIVEDNDSLRELLATSLAVSYGFKVVQSPSGNEAIKLLEKGERFTVVVSDFNMPNGNGADLQRYLVQSDCRSLFFFFTSEMEPVTDPAHRYYVGTVQKPHVEKLITEIVMSICTFPFSLRKIGPNNDA